MSPNKTLLTVRLGQADIDARARIVQNVLYEKDYGLLGMRVRELLKDIDWNLPAARARIARECA